MFIYTIIYIQMFSTHTGFWRERDYCVLYTYTRKMDHPLSNPLHYEKSFKSTGIDLIHLFLIDAE